MEWDVGLITFIIHTLIGFLGFWSFNVLLHVLFLLFFKRKEEGATD